ncbi:MAG: cyclic nucleotide-binding domain-containing protein [Syntrophobacteraceae bacterium]|jgi:CRP/FNR family cyclic AMP-dependent transcriptional regulator|nr:cyclic nucleotide-binding domain-containing protein [Syntrophobacteraceae bacterium]
MPLYDELDRETVQSIESIAATRSYPKSSIIIHQGDDSDAFYLVLSGSLQVMIVHEDGRQMLLGTLKPGDYFGELSCVDGDARSTTIMAMEPCKCLVIPKDGFHALCHDHPSLIWALIRDLVRKLRKATRKIEELAFLDVYGRVSRFLTELQDEGFPGEARVTHQDIAHAVGASREMVSRIMKDISDRGYIEQSKGRFRLIKKLPFDGRGVR